MDIFIACIDGKLDDIRYFLDDVGIPLEHTNIRNRTPLFLTSCYGHVDCVRFLLDRGQPGSSRH